MFIAAAADVNVARRIVSGQIGERPWYFIIGKALATDPDRERLIAAAMMLMARDELSVIRLDGAELPLGFRDLDVRDVASSISTESEAVDAEAARQSYSAAVDLYSSTASSLDEDVSLDSLRRDPPPVAAGYSPSSTLAQWGWLLLAVSAFLFAIGALGFWFLTGHAEPTLPQSPHTQLPQPSIQSGTDFLAGIIAALTVVAAMLLGSRWLRWSKSERAPTATSAFASPTRTGKAIFISYSHRDSRIAHNLAEEVQRQGRPAWIFEQQMHGGATGWAGQVVRALRESRAVMLVGSSNAFASDQVMREMYLAMDMRKPIVPLIVDDTPMPDDFQYILAKFQRHQVRPPLDTLVARALADC